MNVSLIDGRLAGATLDLTDPEPLPIGHPLWRAPNVRITPTAWNSATTSQRITRLLSDIIERISRGEQLINQL